MAILEAVVEVNLLGFLGIFNRRELRELIDIDVAVVAIVIVVEDPKETGGSPIGLPLADKFARFPGAGRNRRFFPRIVIGEAKGGEK